MASFTSTIRRSAVVLESVPSKAFASLAVSQSSRRRTYYTSTDNAIQRRSRPSCQKSLASRQPCLIHSRHPTQNHIIGRARFATTTTIMAEPTVHSLFEPVTGTWQYVVSDPNTKSAVIIDPVLDYDPVKAAVSTGSADAILKTVKDNGLKIEMILETHAHADHLTAASYLQSALARSQGSKPLIGIGKLIRQVQSLFGERYGIDPREYDTVFDKLWEDSDEFTIGTLTARAVHLPGHTPDHMGYHIGKNVFVGDSIFHVDIGSARADFPGGSAEAIFNSGRKLLALPEDTKIWVGHDYPPADRETPVPFATVKEHRENNKHLKDGTREHEFIEMRKKRDESLAAPRLIHPSLQVNIRGGRLPAPNPAGLKTIHLPVTGSSW
ncbi:hypothetical protein LB504_005899 [Fusarium proliferatum]|nr:hypothetical protein LB504_005899 [Fusarium proliferatum]